MHDVECYLHKGRWILTPITALAREKMVPAWWSGMVKSAAWYVDQDKKEGVVSDLVRGGLTVKEICREGIRN